MATLGLNIQGWTTSLRSARNSVNRFAATTQKQMRRMSASAKRATGSMRGLGNAADFVKNRIIKAGLFFAGFYQGLIILRQVIGSVISEFFALDENLRKVQSISKSTDEEISNLKTDLLAAARAGETFGQRASEVADAMFEIVQSGFSLRDAFTIAQVAAIGAEAGFTDAATSGRVLVGVMNAFGRGADDSREIMDILFKTVDVGVVTFEELSRGLGRALGPAAALGIDLEELGAIISVLTRRGLQGREAMTALTRIMISFLKPSDKAFESAAKMGFNLSAEKIAIDGLIPSLIELNEKTGGEADALGSVFDRQRAVIGAQLLLIDGGDDLLELWGEHKRATDGVGAATEALNERQKALTFQMRKISVQLLSLTTGSLEPLNNALQKTLPLISDFIAGNGKAAHAIGALMPFIKALIAALIVLAFQVLVPLTTGLLSALAAQLAASGAAMAKFAFGTPALTALALAFGALILAADKFKNVGIQSTLDKFKDGAKRVADEIERINNLSQDGIISEGVLEDRKAVVIFEEMNVAIIDIVNGIQAAQQSAKDKGIFGSARLGETEQRFLRTFGSFFTDTRSDAEVLRDTFNGMFDDMLSQGNLGIEQLEGISNALEEGYVQAQLLGDVDLTHEFHAAVRKVNDLLLKLRATEDAAEKTAIAAGIIGESTADTIKDAEALKKLFEGWEMSTEATEDAIKAILGATTLAGAQMVVENSRQEVFIVRTKQRIGIIKNDLQKAAEELGKSLDDIEEGESAIIDKLNIRLDKENDILDSQEAQQQLGDDRVAVQDAELTLKADMILLLDAEQRAKEGIILLDTEDILLAIDLYFALRKGDDAIVDQIESIGAEKDIMGALLTMVETLIDDMDDGELKIDASNALAAVSSVRRAIDQIPRTISIGATTNILDPALWTGPRNAHGVRNFLGGLSLVGENGPELIDLPRGTNVIPNNAISPTLRSGAAGMSGVHIETSVQVNAGLFEEWAAIKRHVMDEVDAHLDDQAAKAGLGRPRLAPFGAGIPRT